MAQSNNWVKDFSKSIKATISSGWIVDNYRVNMHLILGKRIEGGPSVNLSFL